MKLSLLRTLFVTGLCLVYLNGKCAERDSLSGKLNNRINLSFSADRASAAAYEDKVEGIFGYQISLDYSRRIYKSFFIGAGFAYSKNGFTQNEPSDGLTTYSTVIRDYHYYYSFPVFIQTFLGKSESFHFKVKVGVLPSVYSSAHLTFSRKYQDGHEEQYQDFIFPDRSPKIEFGSFIGIGFEKKLSNNFSISVNPLFRYYFIKDVDFYSLGIEAGIIYEL